MPLITTLKAYICGADGAPQTFGLQVLAAHGSSTPGLGAPPHERIAFLFLLVDCFFKFLDSFGFDILEELIELGHGHLLAALMLQTD